jgi:hypothetical protein
MSHAGQLTMPTDNPKAKPKRLPGVALHPVVSRMVERFKVSVNPCGFCGYSPVMKRFLHESGRDEFCFTCPNDDCAEHWQYPMWEPTKQLAAEKWNAANHRI